MSGKGSGSFLSTNQVLLLALLLFAGDRLFQDYTGRQLQVYVQHDVHDNESADDLDPTTAPIGRVLAFEPDTEAQEEIDLLAKAARMHVNPRGGVPGAFVLAALGICLGAVFLASDTMEAVEKKKEEEKKKNETPTETKNPSEDEINKNSGLPGGFFATLLAICTGAFALVIALDKQVGSKQEQQPIENDAAQEEISVLAESARTRVNPKAGVPGGFMFAALGICLAALLLAFDTMEAAKKEEKTEEHVKSEAATESKTEEEDEHENENKNENETLAAREPEAAEPEKIKSGFFAWVTALLAVSIGAVGLLLLNTEFSAAAEQEASAASEIEIDFLTQSARMRANPKAVGLPGGFVLAGLGTCLGALFLAFDTVEAAEEEEMKKKAPDHIKIGKAIKVE